MKNKAYRFTRRLRFSLGALGFLAFAGCQYATSDAESLGRSEAALHASNADTGTHLFNVIDPNDPSGLTTFPVLATNHTGYRLACPTEAGLTALVSGAGFDPYLNRPAIPLDSQPMWDLYGKSVVGMADLVGLTCNQGSLVAIDAEGERKYFLELANDTDANGKPILRNVGCGELLSALGLDRASAQVLKLAFANSVFHTEDAYDINCATGTRPSLYVPGLTASPQSQSKDKGKSIDLVTFKLQNLPADIPSTLIAEPDDDCGFLAISGLTVSGFVPQHFAKSTCSASFHAQGAGFVTTPVTITINTGCPLGTVTDCGSCGNTCSAAPNAIAACTNYTCGTTCNDGWAHRVGPLSNGCETPVPVQVASGGMHTCAVMGDATVRCWGANTVGQLGDGTTTDRNSAEVITALDAPVKQVTAGNLHTCALMADSRVRCWGTNNEGELGDGTRTSRKSPIRITVGTGVAKPKQLVAGQAHTCALMDDSSVMCWGYNEQRQIGDGTTTTRYYPVALTAFGLGASVKQLVAGAFHNCALMADSSVRCWGADWLGQLGDGGTTAQGAPVAVAALHTNVKQITAGMAHSCALMDDATVKCWGWNDVGQLGDGTTSTRFTPVAVKGLDQPVKQIEAGGSTTCALLADGSARCWGMNQAEAADLRWGDGGQPTPHPSPTPMATLGTNVKLLTVGASETSALMTDGTMQIWGDDEHAQLGNGDPFESANATPTPVKL